MIILIRYKMLGKFGIKGKKSGPRCLLKKQHACEPPLWLELALPVKQV